MATTDKLAIPTTELTALAITTEQLTNIREAIADIGADSFTAFDLARIKVPAGGATSWELPDGEPAKFLDAVIIAAQRARQYYPKVDADGAAPAGVPPTCASSDGITGHGAPGGTCATCPLAAFGEGAPPCKERRHCLLVIGGSILPVFLNLPPASLKALKQYQLQELVSKHQLKASQVITRIGLVSDKNANQQVYSRATFTMLEKLSPEQCAVAAQYAAAMQGLLSTLAFAPEGAPVPVSELSVDDYVTG